MLPFAIVGNLLMTGCGVLAFRRGANPRLMMLPMAVGSMAVLQTAAYVWNPSLGGIRDTYEFLAAALSVYSICLIQDECKESRKNEVCNERQ